MKVLVDAVQLGFRREERFPSLSEFPFLQACRRRSQLYLWRLPGFAGVKRRPLEMKLQARAKPLLGSTSMPALKDAQHSAHV